MATAQDFEEVIGSSPETFCRNYYHQQPGWVKGAIGFYDTRFLFKTALMAGTNVAVEVGTASGFSTGVLCYALYFASKAGLIGSDFQVVSYDISREYYADKSRRVGDAAREQLPPELMDHIVFRNPALALDVRQHHGSDEIKLLFIDADHSHPWPTLDLLATLDSLSPGAVVALHDINLPSVNPLNLSWGPKYLFDDLDIEKEMSEGDEIPNIGSIRIPGEKGHFRSRLLEILFAHEWQVDVDKDYLARLGITR